MSIDIAVPAPVVLFVYNRPEHTRQTFEALKRNVLGDESELFIYSDAPKSMDDVEKVAEVRAYLKTLEGFKKITVIERDTNWGLAASIIDGVTQIVNRYGKIIVLEDDMVTSPYFLKFMNETLDFYENEKKIWHISGWNYPIDPEGLGDVFLWRMMNCWGWGTWDDRWQYFEKNIDKTIQTFSDADIFRFNLDGAANFWQQVVDNKENRINTWAIFWYATIFKRDGLSLNPSRTYVENIGVDGSGTHCDGSASYAAALSEKLKIEYDKTLHENAAALKRIVQFIRSQKRPLYRRVLTKAIRLIKPKIS